MLKWENYVMQQEKMRQTREEVDRYLDLGETQLNQLEQKLKDLKDMIEYFERICQIQDNCINEVGLLQEREKANSHMSRQSDAEN